MKANIFKKLNGKGLKVAIVQARFNQEITDGLTKGALKALKGAGVAAKDIKIFQVPGSFEIPLTCQKIIKAKKSKKIISSSPSLLSKSSVFDGILAIGAIIKGETAHFDFIAKATTEGIMRTMLEYDFPITFGVITAYNWEQAKARAKDDKDNKGYEAALALVELIKNFKEIK